MMHKYLLLIAIVLLFTTQEELQAQSDEPCTATQLIVGSNGICTSPLAACINPPSYTNSTSSSAGVTLPALACNGFSSSTRDFWFKAVVPASGKLNVRVRLSGDSLDQQTTLWDMAFYTSSNPSNCAGSVFTQIGSECKSSSLADTTIVKPAGTVIYIRMWRQALVGSTPTDQAANRCFSICVKDPPTTPPPCAVISSPLNGATNVNKPVTFKWKDVPTSSSYIFYFGVNNPPDSLGVTTDTTVTLNSIIEYSTTYYWKVVPRNEIGNASSCPVYTFTTSGPPPVPANDDCSTAATLTPFATASGTTLGATQSMAGDTCENFIGDANDDVWYKFTAAYNGNASITLTPTGQMDAVMVGYSGTCGALSKIACADATIDGGMETLQLNNLFAGQTIYFRVYAFRGAGYEGSFTLSATGTALPVTLISFNGYKNKELNILNWVTTVEQNVKGFEIQRSVDGMNFSSIGFIESKKPDFQSEMQYTFTDERPFAGQNFYRLKIIDNDGRYKLSDVVFIKGEKLNSFVLSSIYPNPVINKLNVVLQAPYNDKMSIMITDLTGKIVTSQNVQVIPGSNNFSLDVNKFAKGNYFIKVVCDNGCEKTISRFLKQ